MRFLMVLALMALSYNSFALKSKSLRFEDSELRYNKIIDDRNTRVMENQYMRNLANETIQDMKSPSWKGLGVFQVIDVNDYLYETNLPRQ